MPKPVQAEATVLQVIKVAAVKLQTDYLGCHLWMMLILVIVAALCRLSSILLRCATEDLSHNVKELLGCVQWRGWY